MVARKYPHHKGRLVVYLNTTLSRGKIYIVKCTPEYNYTAFVCNLNLSNDSVKRANRRIKNRIESLNQY